MTTDPPIPRPPDHPITRHLAPELPIPDDDALMAECDVDTFRAGGPGGQHQNKTESAVRLTHRPSGIVVIARQSRSQHRNRQEALDELRRRLEERARPEIPRVPTKPSRASRVRRVEAKKRQGQRKAGRRWKPDGEE
jgi:protein subunit release factor A